MSSAIHVEDGFFETTWTPTGFCITGNGEESCFILFSCATTAPVYHYHICTWNLVVSSLGWKICLGVFPQKLLCSLITGDAYLHIVQFSNVFLGWERPRIQYTGTSWSSTMIGWCVPPIHFLVILKTCMITEHWAGVFVKPSLMFLKSCSCIAEP